MPFSILYISFIFHSSFLHSKFFQHKSVMSLLPDMDALSRLNELYVWTKSIQEARYTMGAMCALQLYEWIALLDDEIQVVHKRRMSKVNILYLACRYYPAALWIIVMWALVGNHSLDFCMRVAKPVNALLAPCQLLAQGVMMVRAYGFSKSNRYILIFLSVCYLFFVCVNIWVFCFASVPVEVYTVFKKTGCFVNYGEGAMALKVGYSILASTIMDLISLIIVIVYCVKDQLRQDVPLARYFMKQGVVSFVLVFATNVVCFAVYIRSTEYQRGLGLPIVLILPNLIACRVLLQLRQMYNPDHQDEIRLEELDERAMARALRGAGLEVDPLDDAIPDVNARMPASSSD